MLDQSVNLRKQKAAAEEAACERRLTESSLRRSREEDFIWLVFKDRFMLGAACSKRATLKHL